MLPDELPDELPSQDSHHAAPGASSAAPGDGTALGLSPERVDALRHALGSWARGEEPPPGALRDLLCAMSVGARADGIPAERLLVEFKRLWYALPDVRQQRAPQQAERLAELVTLCIREYYGSAPGAPGA